MRQSSAVSSPAGVIVRSVLTYRSAETGFNIYYLVRDGPKNQPIKAFPKGLRMVAGDTNRKTYNASSFEDHAVSYVCLGGFTTSTGGGLC